MPPKEERGRLGPSRRKTDADPFLLTQVGARLRVLQACGTAADYVTVQGQSFADALDAALGGAVGPTPASRPRQAFAATPAHPLLFFRLPALAGRRATFVPVTPKGATVPAPPHPSHRPVDDGPARASRPPRTLAGVHQLALDLLNAHGAALTADFDGPALRRAYRQLARRFHPDAHPHVGRHERDRLAARFSRITAGYRRLLPLVEPLH